MNTTHFTDPQTLRMARADLDNRAKAHQYSAMETKIAKLESAAEHTQTDIAAIKTDIREIKQDSRIDFRLLFAAIIAVALGLATMMAKGFQWM